MCSKQKLILTFFSTWSPLHKGFSWKGSPILSECPFLQVEKSEGKPYGPQWTAN